MSFVVFVPANVVILVDVDKSHIAIEHIIFELTLLEIIVFVNLTNYAFFIEAII
jgi:hypothetical protein